SVTDRAGLRPVRVGLEIAAAFPRLSGSRFEISTAAALPGSKEALARLEAGDDPARIAAGWAADESRWRLRRAPYLLYPWGACRSWKSRSAPSRRSSCTSTW